MEENGLSEQQQIAPLTTCEAQIVSNRDKFLTATQLKTFDTGNDGRSLRMVSTLRNIRYTSWNSFDLYTGRMNCIESDCNSFGLYTRRISALKTTVKICRVLSLEKTMVYK